MPEIYAFPNDTIVSLDGYFIYLTSLEPLIFPLIMLGIFVILLIATKLFSGRVAFTFSSFICTVLTIPLAILGFMAPMYMYLFVVLTGFGVLWGRLSKRDLD